MQLCVHSAHCGILANLEWLKRLTQSFSGFSFTKWGSATTAETSHSHKGNQDPWHCSYLSVPLDCLAQELIIKISVIPHLLHNFWDEDWMLLSGSGVQKLSALMCNKWHITVVAELPPAAVTPGSKASSECISSSLDAFGLACAP
jgi:hypothetical protein